LFSERSTAIEQFMAEIKPQQEPSMEEILASIRRIISEDAEPASDAAPQEAAPAAEPVAEPEAEAEGEPAELPKESEAADEQPTQEGDVLDLTEMVDDQGNTVNLNEGQEAVLPPEPQLEPAPEPEPEPESPPPMSDSEMDQLLEQRAAGEAEPAELAQPEEIPPEIAIEEAPAEPEPGLVADGAEVAAASAFDSLLRKVDSGPVDESLQRITPGGRTIEEHVLELLRPMLQQWLDKYLPELVERLVQREIDRIARRPDPK
jgi:cell pole-organizing protein PopZ